MDAWLAEMRALQKETTACKEAPEACLESKEPASLQIESEAEHEEVPKQEAAVKPVRALKKWHGDQNLALGSHQKLKKRTQGSGGSQKKIYATCTGMTNHAGVAGCKRHGHQGQGQNNVVQGTQKGRAFGKKHWVQP
jgi:hypothetical protein